MFRKEYFFHVKNKTRNLIIGFGFIGLGISLKLTSHVFIFLSITLQKFVIQLGWISLVFIGSAILFSVFVSSLYKSVVIDEKNLYVRERTKELIFSLKDIKGIQDYYDRGNRILTVTLVNNKVFKFYEIDMDEYDEFSILLQNAHSKAILSDDFPENIEGLSIALGKHLALFGGAFHYKHNVIKPEQIISYIEYPREHVKEKSISLQLKVSSYKEDVISLYGYDLYLRQVLIDLLTLLDIKTEIFRQENNTQDIITTQA